MPLELKHPRLPNSETRIVASSAVTHPKLSKSIDGVNRIGEFIFHTHPTDPAPEVNIFFNPPILDEAIYVYNRTGSEAICKSLDGVQFSLSTDGQGWSTLDISLSESQISGDEPIVFQQSEPIYAIRLSRDKPGKPIHIRQISIGGPIEELAEPWVDLTERFAKLHRLDLNKDGSIFEAKNLPGMRLSPSLGGINSEKIADCICISNLGRFSNALVQLSNSLLFARRAGIDKVYIADNTRSRNIFPFPETEVEDPTTGVKIILGQPPTEANVLNGNFFYVRKTQPHMVRTDEPMHELLWGLCPHMKFEVLDPIPSDQLVIHIRSGDIFDGTDRIHPGYGQPPLAFYLKAIEEHRPLVVHIVFEDRLNPVIQGLIEALSEKGQAFVLRSGDLRGDISFLLRAKSLVRSMGTFIDGVGSLSPNLNLMYHFNQVSKPGDRNDIRNVLVKDDGGRYVRAIMSNNWSNSAEQRDLMVSYPIEELSVISVE